MSKKIILLQCKDELSIVKTIFGKSLNEFMIIAWSPFAIDALVNSGLTFSLPTDYIKTPYDPDDAPRNLNHFQQWCDILDAYVQARVPEVARWQIRPFLNKIHNLRSLFNIYRNEVQKLLGIVQELSPVLIYYFNYHSYSALCQVIKIYKKNFFSNKTEIVSLENPLSFQSLYFNGLVPDWTHKDSLMKNLVKNILYRPEYKDVFSFIKGLTGGMFVNRKKPNLLVLSTGWGLNDILIQLKREDRINLIFWEDIPERNVPKIQFQVDEFLQTIENDERLHEWTTIYGVDFFDYVKDAIKEVLNVDLPQYITTIQQFQALHNKIGIDLVLSVHEIPVWEAIFDQCEIYEIPVATFLHGGTVGHIEGLPPMNLYTRGRKKNNSYHYLVYSQAIVKYLEDLKTVYPCLQSKNIAVGSPYFDKLLNNYCQSDLFLNKQPLYICYICGPIGLVGSDNKKGCYDDPSLYALRYEVVKIFHGLENYLLSFKFGYADETMKLDLHRQILNRHWSNIRGIPSTKRLTNILSEMDMFILESPSTVLYEVLTTSKPVIALFDKRGLCLSTYAKSLLERRITIVESSSELVKVLEDIIRNHTKAKVFTKPNHNDKTFIETFATCGDYNSIDRSVKFLQSIINKKK